MGVENGGREWGIGEEGLVREYEWKGDGEGGVVGVGSEVDEGGNEGRCGLGF